MPIIINEYDNYDRVQKPLSKCYGEREGFILECRVYSRQIKMSQQLYIE